jgi:hypothetical protein
MEELEGADTLTNSAHTHIIGNNTANNTSASTSNGHQSSVAATSTRNGITGNSSASAVVNDSSGSNVTPRGSPSRQNAWSEDETEASFHSISTISKVVFTRYRLFLKYFKP